MTLQVLRVILQVLRVILQVLRVMLQVLSCFSPPRTSMSTGYIYIHFMIFYLKNNLIVRCHLT